MTASPSPLIGPTVGQTTRKVAAHTSNSMIHSLPKPNTQALSWFYGEFKKGTLNLKPKYQRHAIWSPGQKCFLIDSLISGSPIPQVYINVITKGDGVARKTTYEVVDGQQRLRAILDFMADKYKLIKMTAKAYPVSDSYKPHIGKKYSELPGDIQEDIWNYILPVQELRGWDQTQIRSLFRRLNYVVERLNKQEMRHSQYFGEFADAVDSLSDNEFWDETTFFTRRDAQRMKDAEFISELLVLIMDGPQDGQKSLDSFYASRDVDFPDKAKVLAEFKKALASVQTLGPYFAGSRFRKKGDFYALFAAVAHLNRGRKNPINLANRRGALEELEAALQGETVDDLATANAYHSTIIEGPNKKAKRKERIQIVLELLSE